MLLCTQHMFLRRFFNHPLAMVFNQSHTCHTSTAASHPRQCHPNILSVSNLSLRIPHYALLTLSRVTVMPKDTWVEVPAGGDFPVENIPWGVFSTRTDPRKRVGTRIGDHVVDVRALHEAGLLSTGPHLSGAHSSCFQQVRTLSKTLVHGAVQLTLTCSLHT